MKEFDFISELLAPLADGKSALNLTDDVALLSTGTTQEIVTTDTIVENRHFRSTDPWSTVGQKLVRVNVSDCLAKAAVPRSCLINITWNRSHGEEALRDFVSGVRQDLRHFAITLLGGDTTSHDGPAVFSLTLFGACQSHGPIRRNGARPGDDVWVSGVIGDAGLGLQTDADQKNALSLAYLVPQLPELSIVSLLADHAHASMDVSDGLIADIAHMSKASEVLVELDLTKIPVSAAVREHMGSSLTNASVLRLAGYGDDYQVLFTAAAEERDQIAARAAAENLKLTRIGDVRTGAGVVCRYTDGRVARPEASGWQHSLFG